MSIQDDFFDVDSALEGKPEQEQFKRIWEYLCRLEHFHDHSVKVFTAMETSQFWGQQIKRGDWREW